MMPLLNRKRLSLFFSAMGVVLMGVDLLMTGSFFVHIGELMGASILCFIIGIALDRKISGERTGVESRTNPPDHLQK